MQLREYVKRISQRSTESRGFLRVLWFPPTGKVDRVKPLTDSSTVAVLCDLTRVIRWLLETPFESLRLDQVELRPLQVRITSHNLPCSAIIVGELNQALTDIKQMKQTVLISPQIFHYIFSKFPSKFLG